MRKGLLLAWLVLPLAWAAWHFGPGQNAIRADVANRSLSRAEKLLKSGDLEGALERYKEALESLPEGTLGERRKIQVASAKLQIQAGQLPEAHQQLQALVEELTADPKSDAAVLADARDSLAQARYYMAWLIRLEGGTQDQWEPEIDSARQTYRLLAEQSRAAGDTAGEKQHQEDLEASIRLARMDLDELQGLNLPKQCSGCCSGKCNGKGKKPGQKPGKTPQDSRSAGSGPPLTTPGTKKAAPMPKLGRPLTSVDPGQTLCICCRVFCVVRHPGFSFADLQP